MRRESWVQYCAESVLRRSTSKKPPFFRKMKFAIAFAAVLAVALAAPPQDERDAQITKYENDNLGVDGYRFV